MMMICLAISEKNHYLCKCVMNIIVDIVSREVELSQQYRKVKLNFK